MRGVQRDPRGHAALGLAGPVDLPSPCRGLSPWRDTPTSSTPRCTRRPSPPGLPRGCGACPPSSACTRSSASSGRRLPGMGFWARLRSRVCSKASRPAPPLSGIRVRLRVHAPATPGDGGHRSRARLELAIPRWTTASGTRGASKPGPSSASSASTTKLPLPLLGRPGVTKGVEFLLDAVSQLRRAGSRLYPPPAPGHAAPRPGATSPRGEDDRATSASSRGSPSAHPCRVPCCPAIFSAPIAWSYRRCPKASATAPSRPRSCGCPLIATGKLARGGRRRLRRHVPRRRRRRHGGDHAGGHAREEPAARSTRAPVHPGAPSPRHAGDLPAAGTATGRRQRSPRIAGRTQSNRAIRSAGAA